MEQKNKKLFLEWSLKFCTKKLQLMLKDHVKDKRSFKKKERLPKIAIYNQPEIPSNLDQDSSS